ncbi:protein c1orf9-like protein [Lasius niger]|uniref:Protein c1orf9-like protein n=1 Tax=Lasius niger TaxID=67767 RepID=A0A0J7NAV2_LASNI|nr:protein c1orf9-like protein [Lasius niger]
MKILSKEDMKKESFVSIFELSKEFTEKTLQPEMLTTVPSNPTPTLKIVEELPVLGTSVEMKSKTISSISPMNSLDNQQTGDTLVPDMKSAEIIA